MGKHIFINCDWENSSDLDSNDKEGTCQRPKPEEWVMGQISSKVQIKESKQKKEAPEETREEGIYTFPTSSTREQGIHYQSSFDIG